MFEQIYRALRLSSAVEVLHCVRSDDEGKLHRDGDKPAIEWDDGRKEWWVDGKWVMITD